MQTSTNKYVGPLYCRAEMYAGRVACCPLVSHGEYADRTDRQTDRDQTVKLLSPIDAASVIGVMNRSTCTNLLRYVLTIMYKQYNE